MIFEHHPIPAALLPNIESIFYFKDFMPDHSKERVVPTGHVFLIFELDGYTRHTFDNETLEPSNAFSRAWISGMHQKYLTISAHERSEMLVVQFKPYGALPFLHHSMVSLNDAVCPAEAVLGEEILHLQASLVGDQKPTEKLMQMEKYLRDRILLDLCAPKDVVEVVASMRQGPLLPLVNHVHHYPHSAQYLIKQFKKHVGLTPKYYLRILRFNEILQKIKIREKISWTDIAYQCGYSDQSHFIKEFKHFSGFNPSEFMGMPIQKDEVNFFPLDRGED